MELDLSWIVGNVVERVQYDAQTRRWFFAISDQTMLAVDCSWKIILPRTVPLASGDHGQQYGLTSPIDAAGKAMELLARHKIRSIASDKLTSDLTINFEDDIILRTFNASSGFEAWQLTGPQGVEFIAQGNGNIVTLSAQKRS